MTDGKSSNAMAALTPKGARVMLVDDEPSVTSGLQRHLRSHFVVTTADSGAEALKHVAEEDPFAVIVTDMRMPEMDGVALLRALREQTPDTVRILLTGYADIDSAMSAVNDGNVFRFLCKPCPPATVAQSLKDAVEQYRLVVSERELLEHTLLGSVRALQETLSLANPAAFARAERIRKIVISLLQYAHDVPNKWEIDIAASLSQVGAVTLPPTVIDKLHRGQSLEKVEQAMVNQLPVHADRLIASIPRLENVRRIIDAQQDWEQKTAPIGTKFLKLAEHYDTLESQGLSATEIVGNLLTKAEQYGEIAITALKKRQEAESGSDQHVETLHVGRLEEGMVLASDVKTRDGLLLVGRGHTVTSGLLERIRNFSASAGLQVDTVTIVVAGVPQEPMVS